MNCNLSFQMTGNSNIADSAVKMYDLHFNKIRCSWCGNGECNCPFQGRERERDGEENRKHGMQ